MINFPLETINKYDGYNIRFEEWVPQLNVLAHESVKLFVTHGGMESIHEVLYVGKPSIIVPFFGDQHAKAVLSRDRGLGDFLNKNTMTSIDICKKVHNLIIDYGNRSSELYHNFYKMSRIVNYNLNSYKEIYNVLEMEMENGSQHLIPPSVSWIVANDADLWATIFAIISISVYAIWFAYKKLCSKQKIIGCLYQGFGFSDGLCPAGFSCRNFKNSSPPAPCPPGTFSILGQHDCKPCAPGYYTNHSASESCEACPAGFMCPFADQNPVACPVGTYTSFTRQSCCSLCPVGTYNTRIASTNCVKCPAGASCRPVSPPSCGEFKLETIFRSVQ
ncbi:unnamed protein product [Rotaria socialis]